jgi:glycosyltransferase involved in cell wall biosynthesis
MKKEDFKVIHIHSSTARWGFALCAWMANIPSVYTFHNVFKSRFFSYPFHLLQRFTIKHLFRCRFQTISDSVYQNELEVYFNDTTKINNWYGGQRYYPAVENEKYDFRKELGIDNSTLVLISVGGCSPVKRHTDIIKALPLILEKTPDCLYLHLGTGCSEKDEKELAISLGVLDKIRFLGNQENVRKYLVASDIYIMTSRFEGISLTTIEAMACNIPAVLYDVPGLRDFNKHGNNSILIPEDYKLLAEAVLQATTNTIEIRTMANNAKITVDKLFNMQNNALEIYQLYSV